MIIFTALLVTVSVIQPVPAMFYIEGRWSSKKDDAESLARCPPGYVVSYCEVKSGGVHTKSDGAYIDFRTDARDCIAVNGHHGSGVIARAGCSRKRCVAVNGCAFEQRGAPCYGGKGRQPKFLFENSRGSAPRVSCPSSYEQILCIARSPWSGLLTNKGVNTRGIIPNYLRCAVSWCSTRNWCEVTAVCRLKKKCKA